MLAVDALALTALLRAHNPLDVLSKWALVRGQIEPRVWAEIDAILMQLKEHSAPTRDAAAKTTDHSHAQFVDDQIEAFDDARQEPRR